MRTENVLLRSLVSEPLTVAGKLLEPFRDEQAAGEAIASFDRIRERLDRMGVH